MFVDLTIPIRAIYFPVAQTSDDSFSDMCTYLMMDFTHETDIKINSNQSSSWWEITGNPTYGLDHRIYDTIVINMQDIYGLLSLPHQLRGPDVGPFISPIRGEEPIQMLDCHQINYRNDPSVCAPADINFLSDIDLVAIINANFGIDIKWRPFKESLGCLGFIEHLIEAGLSMIPGVGPLLSTAWSVGVTLIVNPGAFDAEYAADTTIDIITGLHESAKHSREFLPQEWQDQITQQSACKTDASGSAFPLSITGGSTGATKKDGGDGVSKTGRLLPNPLFASRLPPPPPASADRVPVESTDGDFTVDSTGQV